MMGMMGDSKKKKIAALIISAGAPMEDKEDSGEYEKEMMKSLGDDLLSALGIEGKDGAKVAEAICALAEMHYSKMEGEEESDGKES